jgi:S1-C subfamily serine protease
LATSAVAVLVSGYVLRPQTELPAASSEEPAPILREVVTRRQTTGLFTALQDTARAAVGATARLTVMYPPPDRWSDWQPLQPRDPRRFAVPIDATRLLGDGADLEEGTQVEIRLGNGRTLQGRIGARYPASRLAVIETATGDPLPVPTARGTAVVAGDLVVGVAPGEEAPVTVPLVVAETSRGAMDVTEASDRFLGIAVFSADGSWLGVLAAGSAGMRILPADAIMNEPPEADSVEEPLGVSLRAEQTRSGDTRIVVDAVASDGRAATAGLRAGDILLAVDDTAATALDAAVAALQGGPGRTHRLRVRRGTRTVVVRIPPADPR